MNRAGLVPAAVLAVAIGAPIMAYQTGRLGAGDLSSVDAVSLNAFPSGMASFDGATGWINSPPLSFTGLRGKVVVVDFWTYTCINWRRQLPYVRAWADKYRENGLVVVGVHTPEFGFERDADNVRHAVTDTRVDYPVALDSDYRVWREFGNHYWPALYLIDAQGRIRHRQFGEGNYERSERILQKLLGEAGEHSVPAGIVVVDARGPEAPADLASLRSPETYVGFDRSANFASPGGIVRGVVSSYTVPPRLNLNQWALSGDWTVQGEGALLEKAGGRIAYRFHARDLHLVMGPRSRAKPVRFRVLLDGHAPGASHGVDVDEHGIGIASGQRMYQLVRQVMPFADRHFEIEFLDPGAEAFSFTFG